MRASALPLLPVVLVPMFCAPQALAQSAPKPAANEPVPTAEQSGGAQADESAAPALTLEALTIAKSELPKGLVLVEGLHCVSVQATQFFESPEQHGILPAPVATASQSFAKGKERPGSLLVLQYAEAVPEAVRQFVPALMWGGDGRSAEHPEELLFSGEFLVVLSFPQGSEARQWVAGRLRTECRLPALREWPKLAPLVQEAMQLMEQRDAKGGLALLRKNAAKIKDFSLGQYLLGEFASASKDWAAAETAYERAIALHDQVTDPLPNGEPTLWAALDGLSIAMLHQDNAADSIPVLQRSSELGRRVMTEQQAAHSLFNLACAQARLKHFDEALEALTESIGLDETRREAALKDSDLAEARERPEFKELLAS